MNKIYTTILAFLYIGILSAQQTELSEQDIKVIKSYKFDIEETAPIFSDISIGEQLMSIKKEELPVDLLPIQLEDITMALKPLAHNIIPSKFNKAFVKASYGLLQNIDASGSFRHQVPQYFMYGLDARYAMINDAEVLDKNETQLDASGFLRYYLTNKTWIQVDSRYGKSQNGIFGFNTPQTLSLDGQHKTVDIQHLDEALTILHKWAQNTGDIKLNVNSIFTSNKTNDLSEALINSSLIVSKKFKKNHSISLDIDNNHIAKRLNTEGTNNLLQGELTVGMTKPKIGAEVSAKSYYEDGFNFVPNAEFYLKGKRHYLSIYYDNTFALQSYHALLTDMTLLNTASINTKVSQQKTIGLSYSFEIPNSHQLTLSAARNENINKVMWINNIENQQVFDLNLVDFNYYSFGLNYKFFLLDNLSFSQDANYRLLDKIEKTALPHFQSYTLTTEFRYDFHAFNFSGSYTLGDLVYYSDLLDYDVTSDFQHDMSVDISYHPSEKVEIYLEGIDLLDNRFERYAGYQDYGRRAKIGTFIKF